MTNASTSTPHRPPLTNDIREIDGATIAVVLQRGSLAILDRADYEDLRRRGLLGRMFLNANSMGTAYVRMQVQTNIVTVARLIAAPLPGEQVRYRNGSRLDLRRANLYVERARIRVKSAQAMAADLYPRDRAAQVAWLKRRSVGTNVQAAIA